MRQFSAGSPTAKIVVVGEGVSSDDLRKKKPFSGTSGWMLDEMFKEVGIARHHCYLTNVLHESPPSNAFLKKADAKKLGIEEINGRYPHPKVQRGMEALHEELDRLEPNVIIALGDMALWAVTGQSDGITKWRGSVLYSRWGKVVPTYHPAKVLRTFSDKWIATQDLRRAFHESLSPDFEERKYKFLMRPTFSEAMEALESIRGKEVSCDIEFWQGQIECVGFGLSDTEAFCIPIMERAEGNEHSYWSKEDEYRITELLMDILTDKTTKLIFQNGGYDLQQFAKQYGILANMTDDTMIMMHVCFPGLPKSLDFQSSLFSDKYTYWKDMRKGADDETNWEYNCKDCCYTFENHKALRQALAAYNLTDQYEFQMQTFWVLFKMMLRGVRVDVSRKVKMSGELLVAQQSRMQWLETVLGHEFNPRSPAQMKSLFYHDLGLPEIKDRKTRSATTNSAALQQLKSKQPLIGPLVDVIEEVRSIGVFKSTFADAKIDSDNRIRCNFNVTGTETFRLSSSKNIWGTGMNLQNIPKGSED